MQQERTLGAIGLHVRYGKKPAVSSWDHLDRKKNIERPSANSDKPMSLHRRNLLAFMILGAIGVGMIHGLVFGPFFESQAVPIWAAPLLAVLLLVVIRYRTLPSFETTSPEHPANPAQVKAAVSDCTVPGGLPSEFRVLNNVITSDGALDRVVVGPTGVFVVETLICVTGTNPDELVAGRRPQTALIEEYTHRVTKIEARLQLLIPAIQPRLRVIFVCDSATAHYPLDSSVHALLQEDEVQRHILQNTGRLPLRPDHIRAIAQALLGLANTPPLAPRRVNLNLSFRTGLRPTTTPATS